MPLADAPLWSLLGRAVAGLMLLVTAACGDPPTVPVEEWPAPNGTFVETWRDDFSGPADAAPDPARWNLEVRELWFNDELQSTTGERKNSYQDGSGNLVIKAIRENHVDASGIPSAQPFTSARLNTHGKLDQMYGRFEARIKLPAGGRGVWPAFWMLGSNIEDVGWPECGEIDILEMAGSKPNRVVGSLHAPGYYAGNAYHDHYDLPAGEFGDDFHVFTIEWTPEAIRWLLDGQEYFVKTADAVRRSGRVWAYDTSLYLILNISVGGIFDGDPAPDTLFPQEMVVDYVSVSRFQASP